MTTLLDTTAATVTSQTELILTAGSTVDDAYNGQSVILEDASNSSFPSVRHHCVDYVGSTKTLTVNSAPNFTIIAGDGVKVILNTQTAITSDAISPGRTWAVGPEGNTSEEIVKLNTWSSGVRRVSFDLSKALSPGTTINAISSATITKVSDSSTVTTSNLVIRQDKRAVNFDIAAISSAATYEAAVTITTSDDDTINVTATMYVE